MSLSKEELALINRYSTTPSDMVVQFQGKLA